MVETILKAVGALVRLREKGQMGLGLKNSKSSCRARFHVCHGKQRLASITKVRGVPWTIWMGCWGCPFNHSVQDGVGGAHLGTCTFPLFPHSLFTSSLTQTFHPLLLRAIDRPGRSPVCSRLVVVDVEAGARTCLDS